MIEPIVIGSLLIMKVNANQLTKQLAGKLSAIYLVAGDEPLLCMEALDSIRACARSAGYLERQLFNVEANFTWTVLTQAAASLSLFAEKRILEFHLKTFSLADKGEAIINFLANPHEDTLLLITAPKLESKHKWVKALLESPLCQVIPIWPVESNQLPQWIKHRLAKLGLAISNEALELFALRVEGNLLAAAQEVEKLKLLMGNESTVEVNHIQTMVVDSARFDVSGLVDIALQGDAEHSLRMLQGLQAEGAAETLILWSLTKELRTLMTLAQLTSQGIALERAFFQIRPPVWSNRQALLQRAMGRYSVSQWGDLLIKAQQIDAQIKGQATGDYWQGLADLILAIAGHSLSISKAMA